MLACGNGWLLEKDRERFFDTCIEVLLHSSLEVSWIQASGVENARGIGVEHNFGPLVSDQRLYIAYKRLDIDLEP